MGFCDKLRHRPHDWTFCYESCVGLRTISPEIAQMTGRSKDRPHAFPSPLVGSDDFGRRTHLAGSGLRARQMDRSHLGKDLTSFNFSSLGSRRRRIRNFGIAKARLDLPPRLRRLGTHRAIAARPDPRSFPLRWSISPVSYILSEILVYTVLSTRGIRLSRRRRPSSTRAGNPRCFTPPQHETEVPLTLPRFSLLPPIVT